MLNRRGIPGLIGYIKDLSWKKKALLGSAPLLLILVVVFVVLSSSSGETPGEAPDDGLVIVLDGPPPAAAPADGALAAPTPDPGIVATRVAEQVEATVTALLPTPTPVPTPDIAATVQAQILENRSGVAPVVAVNPLDSGTMRSPHLTAGDHDYLASLGEDLWIATQLYLRVSEMASSEFVELTAEGIRDRLIFIDDLLAGLQALPPSRPPKGGVTPVVRTYGGFVEGGIVSVQKAVNEFRRALRVFSDAEVDLLLDLGPLDRAQVREHYLAANEPVAGLLLGHVGLRLFHLR